MFPSNNLIYTRIRFNKLNGPPFQDNSLPLVALNNSWKYLIHLFLISSSRVNAWLPSCIYQTKLISCSLLFSTFAILKISFLPSLVPSCLYISLYALTFASATTLLAIFRGTLKFSYLVFLFPPFRQDISSIKHYCFDRTFSCTPFHLQDSITLPYVTQNSPCCNSKWVSHVIPHLLCISPCLKQPQAFS